LLILDNSTIIFAMFQIVIFVLAILGWQKA
jgi:hypothetical protein